MKILSPVPITAENFLAYGCCISLDTSIPAFIPKPLKLGMTCTYGGSFYCDKMERHYSTEEYLFSGNAPMILAVSCASPNELPASDSISVFIISPGMLICLNPGIWHAPCHSPYGPSYYYFMAHNNGDPEETTWYSIHPEPVFIQVRESKDAYTPPYHTLLSLLKPKENMLSHFSKHNIIHPLYNSQRQLIGHHIRYIDQQVCFGKDWWCWMTEEDCMHSPAYFIQNQLLGKEFKIFQKGAPWIIFCGNCPLEITFESNFNSLRLIPGELLRIHTPEPIKISNDCSETIGRFYMLIANNATTYKHND